MELGMAWLEFEFEFEFEKMRACELRCLSFIFESFVLPSLNLNFDHLNFEIIKNFNL